MPLSFDKGMFLYVFIFIFVKGFEIPSRKRFGFYPAGVAATEVD